MNVKKQNKIIVYDVIPQRHDKVLLIRTIHALKDKYKNLIKERNYDINHFKPKVEKEIKKLNYIVLPNYDSFYKKIERIFLKELSEFCIFDNKGLLSTPNVHNMLEVDKYEYNVHFPLGKITLRNLIENEDCFPHLDKYSNKRNIIRPLSKIEKMKSYSQQISNKLV